LLLAAIAAFAPATLVDRRLAGASAGRLRVSDAAGTVWNGTGMLTDATGAWRVPVGWSVAAPALAVGNSTSSCCPPSARRRAARSTSPRTGGTVRDLAVELPATALASALPGRAPVVLGGTVTLTAPAFTWNGERGNGAISAQWRAARLIAGGTLADLGTVNVTLEPQGNRLAGRIGNTGGGRAHRRRDHHRRERDRRGCPGRAVAYDPCASRARTRGARHPGRHRDGAHRLARRCAMTSVARAQRKPPFAAAAPVTAGRVPAIDVLRGLALVAMIAYHFAFDLAYFRVTASNFYHDPFWLHARTLILSSFLLLAGVSLVLARRSESGRAAFWRHVATIAACALAVSVASYLVFPRSYIWFGVLHAIALSLILIRPLAAHPRFALAAGIAVIAIGNLVTSPWFDQRALGWLGFMTAKPVTEDYVPLFPWTGVMLVGIAAGHALVRNEFRAVAPFARWPRALAWLGPPQPGRVHAASADTDRPLYVAVRR
jgi:uncharacterized membrane protein